MVVIDNIKITVTIWTFAGGKVLFTAAMLKNSNRDELAAVIGHECAHILARHAVRFWVAGTYRKLFNFLEKINQYYLSAGRTSTTARDTVLGGACNPRFVFPNCGHFLCASQSQASYCISLQWNLEQSAFKVTKTQRTTGKQNAGFNKVLVRYQCFKILLRGTTQSVYKHKVIHDHPLHILES